MSAPSPDRPAVAAGPSAAIPRSPTQGGVTIGIDAAEVEGRATGVGRYTLEIVRRWIDEGQAKRRYVVFARRREALPTVLRENAEVVTSERDEGVVSWQQLRLPGLLRRRPVDALFAPAYAVPLATRIPAVVAIHDLSFERFPEEFGFRERWRRRILARLAARRAAQVLTISEFSAREIRRLYRLPSDRITVSYPGVDRMSFRPADRPSSGPARPFLLAVGTFLRRRHLDVLIHAFAKLPEPFRDHELVLVGRDRAHPPLRLPEFAERLGVGARVRFVDHVSDDELVKLYQTTELHVCLSAYEGFGLPAAEGLASGASTLLLDQPVFRELWDGCAHFVESPDVGLVARAMQHAIGSRTDLDRVQERLRTRFDWDLCAADVGITLHSVAAAGARP